MTLSPAVQWRVGAYKLDPQRLPATGPKNNILKGDVLSFLQNRSTPLVKIPQKVVLILTEVHTAQLREFVAAVHPDMQDRLLAKAVCHALSKVKSPNLSMAVVDNSGIFRGTVGSPISVQSDDGKDPYLWISFVDRDIKGEGVQVNVNVTRNGDQYTLEVDSRDETVNMNDFLRILTRNVSDPYLMLL
jgi:hypothetical protein